MSGKSAAALLGVMLMGLAVYWYVYLRTKPVAKPTPDPVPTPPAPTPAPAPVPVPALVPAPDQPRGSIVQVTRTSGSDYINIAEIGAYYQGSVYKPVTGGCVPQLDGNSWGNLIDGIPGTAAITQLGPTGRVWLDYGKDVPIDHISVTNWFVSDPNAVQTVYNRIMGCTLSVLNQSGQVVWSQEFKDAKVKYEFDIPARG